MKSVNTIELLEKLEARVEAQLKLVVQQYQNMDADLLLMPAANGGWSIAQCIEHLNTYGRYYLPHIKNGLAAQQGISTIMAFKSTYLGDYFARSMEPGANMKKMKAFKLHVPEASLNPHQVIAEFIQQEEDLLEYLKTANYKNLNKIRIPISISSLIKMRLGDVFRFIIAHNERHLVQASRNL